MKNKIVPISAFQDNYIWCIQNQKYGVIVDPGDSVPVLKHFIENDLQLAAIIITHHHPDHTGGNLKLKDKYGCPIYGPENENIIGMTDSLKENDLVEIPEINLTLNVIEVPGHTRGHIAYYGGGVLFCGDTLFSCGCGRLFEGTPEQMYSSLAKLMELPDETKVYCAHEYTLSNLYFAKAADPTNTLLKKREIEAKALRKEGQPTIPTTLSKEKTTNPFLRTHQKEIAIATGHHFGQNLSDPIEVFTALRKWKDQF